MESSLGELLLQSLSFAWRDRTVATAMERVHRDRKIERGDRDELDQNIQMPSMQSIGWDGDSWCPRNNGSYFVCNAMFGSMYEMELHHRSVATWPPPPFLWASKWTEGQRKHETSRPNQYALPKYMLSRHIYMRTLLSIFSSISNKSRLVPWGPLLGGRTYIIRKKNQP